MIDKEIEILNKISDFNFRIDKTCKELENINKTIREELFNNLYLAKEYTLMEKRYKAEIEKQRKSIEKLKADLKGQ